MGFLMLFCQSWRIGLEKGRRKPALRKLHRGMCDIPSLCTNTSAGIERKEEI